MKNSDDVINWIKSRGLKWRVIKLEASTRTVEEASRALGVDKSLIVKTLIIKCSKSTLAVVIPGEKKLNINKLEKEINEEECRLAKANEVFKLTGYKVGGVPPVDLPEGIRVIVDNRVLSRELVYGGGGEENALLEFYPKELVNLTKALVLDVSDD